MGTSAFAISIGFAEDPSLVSSGYVCSGACFGSANFCRFVPLGAGQAVSALKNSSYPSDITIIGGLPPGVSRDGTIFRDEGPTPQSCLQLLKSDRFNAIDPLSPNFGYFTTMLSIGG